ncbi:hypothetical protein CsSME_00030633 [Camellia sinensis var. sinensis]
MGDEIEKNLEARLKDAIEEAASAKLPLSAKIVGLPTKFQRLKESLQPTTTTTTPPPPSTAAKLSREKLYNLNNLLTEWHMQSKNAISIRKFSSNLGRINLQDKDKDKDKDNGVASNRVQQREIQVSVDGITNMGSSNVEISQQSTHESISLDSKTEAFRWSDRSVDETKVHGLDDKVKSLQRLLVSNNDDSGFRAIGIVGMRGIGKTTLCQVIFKKQEVKNHFLPRIWVCLSKQPKDDPDNKKETVKRMLECLGVEESVIQSADNDHGLEGLLFALRLQLHGKRYLIILDDVWCKDDHDMEFYSPLDRNENCCKKLAYGLPKGCGGTVIVTSRAEELAKKMVGEDKLHRLLPISDESCWEIFKDSAEEGDINLSGGLESLKGKIIEKCDGLPLLAKMMGKIANENLRERTVVPQSQQQV